MNLFEKFLHYKQNTLIEGYKNFQRRKVMFLDKDDVIEEGIFKFKNLRKSGFCTFYTGLSFWNIKSDYFVESRKASKRIKNFTRIFIIRESKDLDNQHLIKQIQEDLKSHTIVYLCYYDRILDFNVKKDFGIWDDEYICIVHYDSNNSVTGITISGKKEDIKEATTWKNHLLKVAVCIHSTEDIYRFKKKQALQQAIKPTDRYKEFQLKSIELQMSIAAKDCQHSYVDHDSCYWYHSSWPILRALNVVSTPNWHGNFYINAISDHCRRNTQDIHILIAATADATILEHIEAGLGDLHRANIWLIDLCPTPLEITRLYAKLRNVRIHALEANALTLVEEGIRPEFFDIVISDAFLTRFQHMGEKEKVVQQWNKILRKGGKIITTCRITGNVQEKGTHKDRESFVENTLAIFDRFVGENPILTKYINRDLVKLKALDYASHIESFPIKEQELQKIFSSYGFIVTNLDKKGSLLKNSVDGEFKPTIYAQIVAKKK